MKIEIPEKARSFEREYIHFGSEPPQSEKLTSRSLSALLICVTGVSGSGKSSLISDILYPALANHFHHAKMPVGTHKKIEGIGSDR